jgi:hypothetical protein
VLAQVALLIFAFCAVLSLIIDVGFMRVTQAQMQNGADSAAIEGLRKRDVGIRNPVTGVTINDPFASDCLRRAAANRMVRWTFDDDLDPTKGDPDYQFGAGPNIELTEGSTSLHALQTISVPDEHSYKPSPQLNQRNQVHGDMVSGRFCYTSDPAPSEGGAYEVQDIVCTEPQRGTGAYARNDFNPNATSPGGPATLAECPDVDEDVPTPWPLGGTGTLDGTDDSAFLVRLRRSNDAPESGVASSGSALPLLFGKGATVAGDNPDSAYSVRRDGFTVRATAIAQARPAFHLGVPQVNPPTPLLAPFVLQDTCVQTPTGAAATIPVLVVPNTGQIIRAGPGVPMCPPGTVMGRFVANAAAAAARTVGLLPPAGVAAPCLAVNSFTARYSAVFSQMSTGPARIIGFTSVDLLRAGPCPPPALPFYAATITRRASTVAPSNATAVVSGLLPAAVPPALVAELMDKNLVRTGVNYGPVLVPVLAR